LYGSLIRVLDEFTEPELAASALITIDLQNDVLADGALAVSGTEQILPNVSRLVSAYRQSGLPIVHMIRIYDPQTMDVDRCRRQAITMGAAQFHPDGTGIEFVSGLRSTDVNLDVSVLLAGGVQQLGPTEVVMFKPRWGAFFRTPLHDYLVQMGTTTVVVCGANFPNCPRTSIYEASERDFRAVVVSDAISGLTQVGIEELRAIGVAVESAEALSASIEMLNH
jgi:nicotinamidase-related amidase